MTYLPQIDYGSEVALGNVSGWSKINKFGRATDCDSGVDTDIWDGADGTTSTDIWVAPTAARIHELVSTSASDDSVGIGAQTVRVYGLQTWSSAESNEIVTMDGVTPVATSNSYVIIHRMKVESAGSAGQNAGQITATAQTDSTITAIIGAGVGQTLMAIYGIPSDRTICITHIFSSILKAGTTIAANLKLLVNERPDEVTTGFNTKLVTQVRSDRELNRAYAIPKSFAGPAIIKLQINTNTNNTESIGEFDGYVVDTS